MFVYETQKRVSRTIGSNVTLVKLMQSPLEFVAQLPSKLQEIQKLLHKHPGGASQHDLVALQRAIDVADRVQLAVDAAAQKFNLQEGAAKAIDQIVPNTMVEGEHPSYLTDAKQLQHRAAVEILQTATISSEAGVQMRQPPDGVCLAGHLYMFDTAVVCTALVEFQVPSGLVAGATRVSCRCH